MRFLSLTLVMESSSNGKWKPEHWRFRSPIFFSESQLDRHRIWSSVVLRWLQGTFIRSHPLIRILKESDPSAVFLYPTEAFRFVSSKTMRFLEFTSEINELELNMTCIWTSTPSKLGFTSNCLYICFEGESKGHLQTALNSWLWENSLRLYPNVGKNSEGKRNLLFQ